MSADDEPAGGVADLGISLAMDDALDNGSEVDPSAKRLIEKQAHLLDLQMENLAGQTRQIAVKHLRERLHAAFELLLAGALAVAVIVVAVVAWQASQAKGVIIQPLSTPQDLEQRGLTGAVVASRLLDRLGEIREATSSVRAGGAARRWRAEDVKVEIPNTGISLAEASRLLRGWLGHETPVTGEVFHDRGMLSLAVRVGDRPGVTVSGREDQFDDLIRRAAEAVLAQTEPYRYAVYLSTQGRRDEALAVAKRLSGSGAADDRAWGYAMWGRLLASQGDFDGAMAMGRRSLELNDSLPATYDNLAAAQRFVGHDEEAFDQDSKAFALMRRQRRTLDPATGPIRLATAEGRVLEAKGDYAGASTAYGKAVEIGGTARAAVAAASLPRALAGQHDIFAAQRQMLEMPANPPEDAAADAALARGEVDLGMEAWPAAVQSLRAADLAAERFGPAGEQFRRSFVWPKLAYALARGADPDGAEALIARMRPDCYLCARMGGRIAGLRGDRALAESRFKLAVSLAPSLPGAYADWGEMRLAAGDAKGAAELLRTAAIKGPGWADPMLYWGEALAAQGRTADAAEKFRAAAARAPQWSLAHLRLAQTLSKLGRADEARGHFTQAKILYQPPAAPLTGQTAAGKITVAPPR